MVTTGDHDDRVVPAHSFKLLRITRKTNRNNPTLIRIDINAGHGAGKSVAATIQENVDIQAFTLNMGIMTISASK
jgi:prolyl oligopeptidase